MAHTLWVWRFFYPVVDNSKAGDYNFTETADLKIWVKMNCCLLSKGRYDGA